MKNTSKTNKNYEKYTMKDEMLNKEIKKFYKHSSPKAKSISYFSSIPNRMAGKRDGREGVNLDLNSTVKTPYLQELELSYHQRAKELYIYLIKISQKIQIVLNQSALSLENMKVEMDELKEYIDNSRISESKLTEVNKGEPKMDRLHALNIKYDNLLKEYNHQVALLNELKAYTDLSIQRIKDNTENRMAIYYRTLLRHHPDKSDLPPTIRFDLKAAEFYYELARNENKKYEQ